MEAIRASDPSAFAAPLFGAEFHLVRGPLGCHESMHLLARHMWGAPGTLFMNEGVAVAADGWYRNSAHAWARYSRDRGEIPALTEFISPHGWCAVPSGVSYPAAGSFVDYVRKCCGLEAVHRLWVAGPAGFEAAVLEATGRTLEELERAWRASLSWRLPAALDLFPGKPPVDNVPVFLAVAGLALAAPLALGRWFWRSRGRRLPR